MSEQPDLREGSEAAPVQRREWPAWAPWAIGFGLLLAGAALGWFSSWAALRPHMGEPTAPVPTEPAVRVGPRAWVATLAPPRLRARPGEQVEITWWLTNTGDQPWEVDLYRLVPEDGRAPVVSLPHTVEPGGAVKLRARVTVPPLRAFWRPAWALTGPDGPVPGGRVLAIVAIEDPVPSDGEPLLP